MCPASDSQHGSTALSTGPAKQANPTWACRDAEAAPDGDAHLEVETQGAALPACPDCDGVLKPAVVFFGESVPKERVETAYERLSAADALLVVGTSLMVFSGYRFVRAAVERGLPIGIVNLGRTRADDLDGVVKVEAPCTEVLPALLRDQDEATNSDSGT